MNCELKMFVLGVKFWFLLSNASHYLPADDIATMTPCESTLGYIDLALYDSFFCKGMVYDADEEYSSQSPSHGFVGGIINLTGSDSARDHTPLEGGGLGGA
jgi:hypothetical protein